jgi:hypothetical protein
VKGSGVQDDQAITIISENPTESLSKITIRFSNPRETNALFAEAELRKDTSPWTITIRTGTLEAYSAQDVTRLLQDLWIVEEMLEELTDISEEMENE